MITHINIVTVYVSDQQRALNFWRDQVGFEVRENREFTPDARWITVAPPGGETCIALWPLAAVQGAKQELGGFSGIAFTTIDITQLYAKLTESGVKFTAPPKKEPWGTSAVFADPDGNLYNVVEPV